MNFLRSLFQRQPPLDALDLSEHDQKIAALYRTRTALREANAEPITARVRGVYPRRVPGIRQRSDRSEQST